MAYLHDVDPDTPVQQLLKAIAADDQLAARLRRRLGIRPPGELEAQVARLTAEISMAKSVIATMPYHKPASSNGSNRTTNE